MQRKQSQPWRSFIFVIYDHDQHNGQECNKDMDDNGEGTEEREWRTPEGEPAETLIS